MALNKKVIWEQVSPEDAELRIQRAFEMLLGDEFGLTDCARLGTAIDQSFSNDYNQGNEKPIIDVRGNRRPVKSIQKVNH
jgi:hypothetical protein